MHVLLIKMSSMGDVIHTLPALSDALQAIPDLEVDWVVEPAFAAIPAWHPAVKNIISIPLRRWRKNIISRNTLKEITTFYKTLRQKKYDLIIDAQGLLKSAIIAKCARGKIHGYDKHSARDKWSSYFYNHVYHIGHYKQQHAIPRLRQLFAKALNYSLPDTLPIFNIQPETLPKLTVDLPPSYFVFLHSTTWETKHYPEIYWKELVNIADKNSIPVYLPWGNTEEKERAERLVANTKHAVVLPQLSIAEIATVLSKATTVISVDTGLSHLSAALGTRTIVLYGSTDPKQIGTIGENQTHLQVQFPCAPCYSKTCIYARTHKTDIVPACYQTLSPDFIWQVLTRH